MSLIKENEHAITHGNFSVILFNHWRIFHVSGRHRHGSPARLIYAAFEGRFGFPEVLITLFAFITAPVSANLMAQAALHLRLRSMSGNVPETLDRPLPWQRQRRNLRRYEKKSNDDLV